MPKRDELPKLNFPNDANPSLQLTFTPTGLLMLGDACPVKGSENYLSFKETAAGDFKYGKRGLGADAAMGVHFLHPARDFWRRLVDFVFAMPALRPDGVDPQFLLAEVEAKAILGQLCGTLDVMTILSNKRGVFEEQNAQYVASLRAIAEKIHADGGRFSNLDNVEFALLDTFLSRDEGQQLDVLKKLHHTLAPFHDVVRGALGLAPINASEIVRNDKDENISPQRRG